MSTIKIKAPAMPEPDTHCFDHDTEKFVGSHSADQLAARDAQWQEMYRSVVEAATALRLALNWKCAVYCNPSNGVEMRMDADAQVWSRVDDMSAALSAITEE